MEWAKWAPERDGGRGEPGTAYPVGYHFTFEINLSGTQCRSS
jgi:hypothetical protein